MSFANVANLLGAGVSSGSTVVGDAVIRAITVLPIQVPPNNAVATIATYPLPANMRNAQMYMLSVSGAISDTDADAPGVVNLYWDSNADGSGVDGTETYLSWDSVNEGVPPVGPNILNFGTAVNYTGPATRITATSDSISDSVFQPGPPPLVGTATETTTTLNYPSATCFTNQINMWYHPADGSVVENLFFIAQNTSATNTAVNVRTQLTIRATAFF